MPLIEFLTKILRSNGMEIDRKMEDIKYLPDTCGLHRVQKVYFEIASKIRNLRNGNIPLLRKSLVAEKRKQPELFYAYVVVVRRPNSEEKQKRAKEMEREKANGESPNIVACR